MSESGKNSCSEGHPPGFEPGLWRLPLLLAVVLAALFTGGLYRSWQKGPSQAESPTSVPSEAVSGQSVRLEIDFGNGARRIYDALAWREDMTVRELLDSAADFQPAIRYQAVGEGASTLVQAIDGVANQGARGQNWLFWVNDARGDRSCGIYALQPGDRVLWQYATEE